MKSKIIYGVIITVLVLAIGYEVLTLLGIDIIPHPDNGALFCK